MPKKDKNILTKIQRQTLEALRSYIATHHMSPTLNELATVLGIPLPTVSDRIHGLVRKGFVSRSPHKWRNLELVERTKATGRQQVHVPLVASVGADNMSVFAQQEFNQFLDVDGELLKGHRDVFAVRAIGNSMRDADIHDGDYILAEDASLEDVKNGDLVIAVFGEMSVVKRLERGKTAIILNPENKSGRYKPIVISGDREDFRVVGRVIDVLRFSEPDDIQYEYL